MQMTKKERDLVLKLISGLKETEAFTFGPEETETLLRLIEAKVLKENALIFWKTSLGATQNLAEEDILDEEGKSYFAR